MIKNTLLLAGSAIAYYVVSSGAALAEVDSDDNIIVSASPLERTVDETIIGTSILTDQELANRIENSVGETLRREPGVSSTFFGPGASRPIIRGLGGDRIRVLDAGIGAFDASVTSVDHAVSIDPASAEKIEIVRGTSTLLYGSSAAGGVVNIFSGRIPSEAPENGVSGDLRVGGSTVDGGVETAGGFDLTLFEDEDYAVVFHGEGFYREGEDYDIPGFAESSILRALEEAEEEEHGDEEHEEEEEVFGTAENSFYESKGGSAGLSFIFENGFIGFSGTAFNSDYGLPGGHGHEEEEGEEHGDEEEEEEEGGVVIDLEQRRFDVLSEYRGDFLFFNKAKLRFGYADYEHQEFEPSGEAGTVFSNEGWEGRLEFVQKSAEFAGGTLNGAVGVQIRNRDYSAIGEEAFVPPSQSDQYGVFIVEELSIGDFRYEIGGRYERTDHENTTAGISRSFDSFSVSGGVGYDVNDNIFVGATAFRTERAPSIEELFSDGPHLATEQFEIGDVNLDEEVAIGVEATARYPTDRFSASINGFYTSYEDFIFEIETGDVEDGLDVFQFVGADATFRGFEAEVAAELFQLGAFGINADATVDYVRATLDDSVNENIPRIPPLTALFGFDATSEMLDFRAEFEVAADQNRTANFELPTEGYESLNMYVTLRPFTNARNLSLNVAATNLTDEEIRLHSSFIKDLAPLPGRNIKFFVKGSF